jgi:hypothetical protein
MVGAGPAYSTVVGNDFQPRRDGHNSTEIAAIGASAPQLRGFTPT